MNKLFRDAHAIRFALGCHPINNTLLFKSQGLPKPADVEFSWPEKNKKPLVTEGIKRKKKEAWLLN